MLGRAHFNSPTVSSVHYYYLSSVALTDSRWSNVNLTVQYLILCLKLYTKDGAGAVDTVQVLNLLGNLLQLLHGVDAEPKNIASTLHRHNNLVNGHFTGLSAVLLQLGQWTFYRFVSCLIATWSMDILQVCQLSYCNLVNGHFTGLSAVLLQLGQWTFYRFVSCLIATWSMDILQVCRLSYCNLVNGHFTGLSAVLLQLGQWTFYRFANCSLATRLTAILQLCHCLFHRFDSCPVAIWSMAIWQFVSCPVAIWSIAIWQFVLMAIWQFVSCPVAIWSIAIWQFVTCPIATWLTVIWQAVK